MGEPSNFLSQASGAELLEWLYLWLNTKCIDNVCTYLSKRFCLQVDMESSINDRNSGDPGRCSPAQKPTVQHEVVCMPFSTEPDDDGSQQELAGQQSLNPGGGECDQLDQGVQQPLFPNVPTYEQLSLNPAIVALWDKRRRLEAEAAAEKTRVALIPQL